MLTRLLNLEPSVFRKIALFTVCDSDFSAPLRDFVSISLVCRAAYRALTENSAPLYFDIFSEIFDVCPLSGLGTAVVQEHAKDELKRRFAALKVLRRGDLDDPHLTEAFWVAYIMFEDSSKGKKNVKRLLAAGIHGLASTFLRQRLYRGSETNYGWPIPNEQNSLAVALLWLSSSLQTLNRETKEEREEIGRLLQPLVFAAFRYPIFSIAEFCFDIAAYTHQPTSSSVHGPYPPPPLSPRDVVYFGRVRRSIRVPCISLFAALSFFVRKEIIPHEIPHHLRPENRRDTAGTPNGPTIDDIRHFYEHCHTHFADFPQIDVGVIPSRVQVPSTLSVPPTLIEPPAYRVGTLTGRWQGSFIIPFLESYEDWLSTLAAPPEFAAPGRSPLYMTLQEHYVCDPGVTVPFVEGTTNAWLPAGFRWNEQQDVIEVFDQQGSPRLSYHTFRRGAPPSGRVVDVIITGRVRGDWDDDDDM
ncbi:hypothetical protein C0993_005576 [Termitomyces sp. T159_Od127]|nr:hypothetical protein C0993_005576 [Termitomyces sp. T159_Od127]